MDKATAVNECQQAFKEYAVELRREGLIPAKQTDLELGIWFADWGSNWEWRSTVPQHCWKEIRNEAVFENVINAGDVLLRILRNEGEVADSGEFGRLSGQIGHPVKRAQGVARGWP